uniref:Uncharacterized protein n=1 Tax=Eutreptiella gymnastica TaxID=73025 RepID=A0A7S4LCR4_9EUGL
MGSGLFDFAAAWQLLLRCHELDAGRVCYPPHPPLREQRPCQSIGRCCFRQILGLVALARGGGGIFLATPPVAMDLPSTERVRDNAADVASGMPFPRLLSHTGGLYTDLDSEKEKKARNGWWSCREICKPLNCMVPFNARPNDAKDGVSPLRAAVIQSFGDCFKALLGSGGMMNNEF